jgi:chromosome partitioning protein
VLKKGRGLRRHQRGEPEVEATAPAEPDAPSDPGATALAEWAAAAVCAAPDADLAVASPSGETPVEHCPEPDSAEEAETGHLEPHPPADTHEPDLEANLKAAVRVPDREVTPEPERAREIQASQVEPVAEDLPVGPVLETAKLPEPPAAGTDMRPMELPRVVAVANQKGGVGKTTTTVNLGAALAELGFRVLVLDLDPQGNATTGLGLNPRDVAGSVYDVLLSDATLDDIIEPTSLKNLFVAPATIDLAGAEIELVPVMSRELRLRKAIDAVRNDYDMILIDCPPSLGLLTVNGLAASDDVIVPIQCEYYALEGLGQLLRNVGLVQANLNPGLEIRGIILTMYDARTKLADQVVAEVRAYFGAKVYDTVVPRTVRLSEAPSFGQPIIVFDPTSRGAKAYRDLAKEVSRGATRRSG